MTLCIRIQYYYLIFNIVSHCGYGLYNLGVAKYNHRLHMSESFAKFFAYLAG